MGKDTVPTHSSKGKAKLMAEKVLGRECPDFTLSDYFSNVYFLDSSECSGDTLVMEVKRILKKKRFN